MATCLVKRTNDGFEVSIPKSVALEEVTVFEVKAENFTTAWFVDKLKEMGYEDLFKPEDFLIQERVKSIELFGHQIEFRITVISGDWILYKIKSTNFFVRVNYRIVPEGGYRANMSAGARFCENSEEVIKFFIEKYPEMNPEDIRDKVEEVDEVAQIVANEIAYDVYYGYHARQAAAVSYDVIIPYSSLQDYSDYKLDLNTDNPYYGYSEYSGIPVTCAVLEHQPPTSSPEVVQAEMYRLNKERGEWLEEKGYSVAV